MATYPLHEFSKFPLYPDFPQPPTGFPTRQTLDIGEIKYEAPNFVSTHATPKILADALDLEFKNLGPLDGIEYPDLMAPEMEITVPTMTVKSQATDEAGIARDIVAEVKRELVKSANLFAQLHRMSYEKTGQWPEWYNERWAPIYRKAVLWEAEFVHHEDPFAALPPDLRGEEGDYSEDRSNLLLAQLLMVTGETRQLEALKQRMGWEDALIFDLWQQLENGGALRARLGNLNLDQLNHLEKAITSSGRPLAENEFILSEIKTRQERLKESKDAANSAELEYTDELNALLEDYTYTDFTGDDKEKTLEFLVSLEADGRDAGLKDATKIYNAALDAEKELEKETGKPTERTDPLLFQTKEEDGQTLIWLTLPGVTPQENGKEAPGWVNVDDVYIRYDDDKGNPTIYKGVKITGTDWFKKGFLKERLEYNNGWLVISKEEAEEAYAEAIARFERILNKNYKWWRGLNGPRKAIVFSMIYNMGKEKFDGFKEFRKAMEKGDFKAAFKDLLDSKRTDDVKGRVTQEAMVILTGQWGENGKAFPKDESIRTRAQGVAWGEKVLEERGY